MVWWHNDDDDYNDDDDKIVVKITKGMGWIQLAQYVVQLAEAALSHQSSVGKPGRQEVTSDTCQVN
jgi:hypothetical protein